MSGLNSVIQQSGVNASFRSVLTDNQTALSYTVPGASSDHGNRLINLSDGLLDQVPVVSTVLKYFDVYSQSWQIPNSPGVSSTGQVAKACVFIACDHWYAFEISNVSGSDTCTTYPNCYVGGFPPPFGIIGGEENDKPNPKPPLPPLMSPIET